MMKKVLLLSCMLLAAFAAPALAADAAKAQKTFINGIDANYPPFAYIDKNGKPAGFDVDAMSWIANKMGFKVKHQPMDWDGIVPSLLTKKIDMVCSGMSITEPRKEKVTFSVPYYTVKKYFVIRDDSTLTPEQIRTGNKKLGVQGGTNEAKWLEENAKNNGWNFDLRPYGSAGLAIEDVVNGRIDAAAMDSAPAEDAINRTRKPIRIIGEFADPDEFGVAFRKEDNELIAMVNKGYELLMKDPYWGVLKDKYLNAK